MRPEIACHLYGLGTVLLWGTSYVATKVIIPAYSPSPIAFMRCLVGSVVLAAVLAILRIKIPRLADLPWFFLSGGLGLALFVTLLNKGVATLSPTTSCIIVATAPIITAFLATFIYKERLSWTGWLAIAMAFAGILVLALWNGVLSLNIGILYVQLAAVAMGLYNIVQRRLTRTYHPIAVTGYGYIAAAILLIHLLPATVAESAGAEWWEFAVACYMGVFPGAVAYLLWTKGLSIAPKTSIVSNYMFLTPFFSGILEFVVIGQAPDTGTLLGGAIILGSLALFAVAGKDGGGAR